MCELQADVPKPDLEQGGPASGLCLPAGMGAGALSAPSSPSALSQEFCSLLCQFAPGSSVLSRTNLPLDFNSSQALP